MWLHGIVVLALFIGLVVGYLAGARRQGRTDSPGQDLLVGTWKLNPQRSEFDSNHRPLAATLILEFDSKGYFVIRAEGIGTKGSKVAERPSRYILDGKEHPVPESPGLKTISPRPEPRTIQAEVRREDGSMVGGGTWVVSADGRSLTATTFGYDAQLRQFKQRTVWDRQ